MYLEQLFNVYYNALKQFSGVDKGLSQKNNNYQRITKEFGDIIKFAMSKDVDNKFKDNFYEVINEFNVKNSKKMAIPDEDKILEFLNPDNDRIFRYRSFYTNAILKDKKLVENFDKAFPKSGLNLTYLKEVELKNLQIKEEKRYNNKVEVEGRYLDNNYDDDFLQHGVLNTKTEEQLIAESIESRYKEQTNILNINNPEDRKKLIERNMHYYEEENIDFSDDLANNAKTAYNLIFNISDKNRDGDELTAENLDLALTTIQNLIENHKQRPLWQRFFGYFGKIGNELKEAERLADKLANRYNLDRNLVATAIDATAEGQLEARDGLRASKNLTLNYDEVTRIDIPLKDLEGYDINGIFIENELTKEKNLQLFNTKTKSFNEDIVYTKEDQKELDNVVDDLKFDSAFDMVDEYELDKNDFFIDKVGNDLNLDDDEEQIAIEKKIATFDKKFAQEHGFIEKFNNYEITNNVYTRDEIKAGKREIESLKTNYKPNLDDSQELELTIRLEGEFGRMEDGTEIEPIIKSNEAEKMLHKKLENSTKEKSKDVSENIEINVKEIESPLLNI